MNFHIFTIISSPKRVYKELTEWPAPSWLDSSIGKSTAPVSQRSWVQIPFKPEFFFRLNFRNCLSCVYNCDDHSLIHCFFRSSNIWIFIYSLSYFLFITYSVLLFPGQSKSTPARALRSVKKKQTFTSIQDTPRGKRKTLFCVWLGEEGLAESEILKSFHLLLFSMFSNFWELLLYSMPSVGKSVAETPSREKSSQKNTSEDTCAAKSKNAEDCW